MMTVQAALTPRCATAAMVNQQCSHISGSKPGVLRSPAGVRGALAACTMKCAFDGVDEKDLDIAGPSN